MEKVFAVHGLRVRGLGHARQDFLGLLQRPRPSNAEGKGDHADCMAKVERDPQLLEEQGSIDGPARRREDSRNLGNQRRHKGRGGGKTHFFKEANYVWRNGCCFDEVKRVINTMDIDHGINSPLNSVTKLYGILVRAKTPEVITWSFQALDFLVRRGKVRTDDCSVRNLTGLGASGKAEKCWIDVYAFKLKLKNYMLSQFIDKMGFPSEFKQKLRRAFEDHSSYIKYVSGNEKLGIIADLGWQAGTKPSQLLMVKFIEETIYLTVMDGSMRTALKAGKIVEEWIEYAKPKESADSIRETMESERKAQEDKDKEEAAASAAAEGGQEEKGGDKSEDNDPKKDTMDVDADGATSAAGKLAYWKSLANRTARSHVTLIPEPESETMLGNSIKSNEIAKAEVERGAFVGVFLDPKCASEATCQAQYRTAALRDDQLNKLLHGALRGVNKSGVEDAVDMESHVLFHVLDGGKLGHSTMFSYVRTRLCPHACVCACVHACSIQKRKTT